MKKIISITSAFVALSLLLPATALARGGENDKKDDRGSFSSKARGWFNFKKHRQLSGKVATVGSTSFTMTNKDGVVFTVNVNSDTKIKNVIGTDNLTLANIVVNDNVWVSGKKDENSSTVQAKNILVTPANTHPAKARGTVTAVAGDTVTLQTNNFGVVSSVTVKTTSDTQVTTADGSVGSTSDVTVGSKVKVRGLWDEIVNVLSAVKIRLK